MMEYRKLGNSGLQIPVLSLGTGTFGGTNEFFRRWGQTDVKEASRLVGICLDRGINFFDTANVYSQGASEEVLGQALKGRRHETIVATKATFTMSDKVNDRGSSRIHIQNAVNDSLKSRGTDHIDYS